MARAKSTSKAKAKEAKEKKPVVDESKVTTETQPGPEVTKEPEPAKDNKEPEAPVEAAAAKEPEGTKKPKEKAAPKDSEGPALPQVGQHVYDAILLYADDMAPARPQTEQSIQQNQRRLKTAVDTLLRLPVDAFGPTLKAVVGTISDHREGAFNERYLFRGFPGLRLPTKDRTRFELLLSLLTTASDVKSFSEVTKHVSLDTLFKYVTDNDQQQKLAGVFK